MLAWLPWVEFARFGETHHRRISRALDREEGREKIQKEIEDAFLQWLKNWHEDAQIDREKIALYARSLYQLGVWNTLSWPKFLDCARSSCTPEIFDTLQAALG